MLFWTNFFPKYRTRPQRANRTWCFRSEANPNSISSCSHFSFHFFFPRESTLKENNHHQLLNTLSQKLWTKHFAYLLPLAFYRFPFCWQQKWGLDGLWLHVGMPMSDGGYAHCRATLSVIPLYCLTTPQFPLFCSVYVVSSRSLQEYLSQSTSQWCFLWLPKMDMISSAEETGGILKNQYWLLQEVALPRANWKPTKHFQNWDPNHLLCCLTCPNVCLQ